MENFNQKSTYERGFFNRAFQEFDEQSFFEALEKRLEEQPYHRKNKGFKNGVVIFSYALNIVSALSASYCVYWLTETLTGFTVLAYLLAGIFLLFLEQLKRKSSNEFFQVFFFKKETAHGWLMLSMMCLAISIASTYFGADTGTKDFAPNAPTLSINATEQEIKDEIAKLEADNIELDAKKNHEGITYFPSQASIKENKKVITMLRKRLINKEDERDDQQKEGDQQHKQKIEITANTIAWILVFLELLFEGCIAYVWYYHYRSFVEWTKMRERQRQQNQNTPQHTAPQTAGYRGRPAPPQEQLPPHYPTADPTPTNTETPPIKNSGSPIQILGYLRADQREAMENLNTHKNTSVQTCTSVYTQDLYTVPHTYQKAGQTVTVHYTEPQVLARYNQYQRAVEEAVGQGMGNEVIENRKRWVEYWEYKLGEVQKKKP